GGYPVVDEDSASRVLIFEYELQNCNSVLMMTEDELVYTFALTYTTEAFAGTPITCAEGAVVGVQCLCQRFYNASSNALKSTWVPYASTEVGEEVLLFSLKPANLYFLGDTINIEVSVMVYNHVPLCVFVDSCVATQVPDVNALLRYSFIENHGCPVDAKSMASSSRFMPRTQEDKIRFQLEAFMVQGGYMMLSANPVPFPMGMFMLLKNALKVPCLCFSCCRWLAADGNHQACGCCDSTCGPDGIQWEGKASLGSVMVQERQKTLAVIHTTPVHQLMSCESKTCTFVTTVP
uniref:Zona pellucida sperm-binding protein 3 n=1 Tax=Cyprinus carpio TaxID=7962 RepID=A0A8C1S5T2_CYPCA